MRVTRGNRMKQAALAAVALAGAVCVVWVGLYADRQTRSEPVAGRADHRSPATTTAAASRPTTHPWTPPRFREMQAERSAMVAHQIAPRDVRDPRVLVAMRSVPRHLFVPEGRRRAAHQDRPLPIGFGQTISQPYIVALMTELLGLQPDSKVLEIGTGSGYQAAVLSELTPHVYTIEILKPLAKVSATRFARLGYTTIRAKQGDGYFGWREHAPFDAIIVTCAAGHLPPPLFAQLKPGGRIVIPIGQPGRYQELQVVTKQRDTGQPRFESVCAVAFVPMVGEVQQRRR